MELVELQHVELQHVVGTSADNVVGNGSKTSDKDSDENRGLADDRGELR